MQVRGLVRTGRLLLEGSLKGRYQLLLIALMALGLLGLSAHLAVAQEEPPVVHAVLFYSPTCGHCKYVITEVLPPLYDKYGQQLQILGFDVTEPGGDAMFTAALKHFGVEQPAVPFLVIDDITLVGSQEIPEQFPGLIDAYLALGGAPWPEIPGLEDVIMAVPPTATALPSAASAPTHLEPAPVVATPLPELTEVESPAIGWRERFAADALANTIAVVVLVAMIAALVWGAIMLRRGHGFQAIQGTRAWIIPALCLLGVAVAGYLAYVEATHVSAVCGPIGDCNAVQQSPYSHLFGVLSVGIVGLIGYVSMAASWLVARFGRGRTSALGTMALYLLALLGTLFSIYLTFLEPFVIGATCAWCLTSAIITATLMLLSAGAAGKAFMQAGFSAVLPAKRPRTS